MAHALVEHVEQSQRRSDLPRLAVGDTVDVHVRIVEGAKERVQVFNGVIVKMQGQGLTQTITVRRIVANEGVERTFPIHSPKVATIQIKRHGHVRRAKLYYLRERVGKKRRLRDRRRGLDRLQQPEREAVGAAADEATELSAEQAQSHAEAKSKEQEQTPVQKDTGRKK